jgi:hypothetical protein
MGPEALALQAGITPAEAKELLRLHKETYRPFWRWMDDTPGVRFASYFTPPAENRSHFIANHCRGNRHIAFPRSSTYRFGHLTHFCIGSDSKAASYRVVGLLEKRAA